MALTPSLKSIEDLFEKLEREARRAYFADERIDTVDHFYNFCVTAHSMKDHFFEHKGIIEKSVQKLCHDKWNKDKFLVAASEIANTSKHFALRKRSGKLKEVKTKTVEQRNSGFVNVYIEEDGLREEFVTRPDLSITLEDEQEYELWNFTDEVIKCWKNFLIEEASAKDYFNKNSSEARLAKCRAAASSGDATAQSTLAFMYHFGQDVDRDFAEALVWYRRAAEQGLAAAQFNLGLMYAKGQGVPRDSGAAVAWFRRAAEKGHAGAQYRLGLSYSLGEGVPQDDAQAATWLSRAAEQEYADAQFSIGARYCLGNGVPQNYTLAYMWSTLAGEGGHEDAPELRDNVAKEMTSAQIADAQRMAREWSDAHRAGGRGGVRTGR